MSRRLQTPEDGMKAPRPPMRETFELQPDEWLLQALIALSAVAHEPRHASRYKNIADRLPHELERGARGTAAHALLQATVSNEGKEAARTGRPSPYAASRIAVAWKALKWETRW